MDDQDIHQQLKDQQPVDLIDRSVPNQWCIIRGVPGKDPLTIVGPFATSDEATQYQQKDVAESSVPSEIDVLVAPANC